MFQMNEQDRIWMAGFFDGEGNIQPYLSAPIYSNRYGQYSLRVNVVNTSHSILEQFSSFGGTIRETSKTSTWKMCYRWDVTGSAAKRFLEAVLPYLKLKKEVAMVGIEFQSCIENWKREHCKNGRFGPRLSKQEIAKRDTLITKFRELQPLSSGGRKSRKPRKVAFALFRQAENLPRSRDG